MNAWSRMNDPREAQQWESTGTLTAVAPYNEPEMTQRLDDVLRRSARLLALTVDRNRTPNAKPDSLFHRGWGRAPLWAQYAGAHRGVCLVLNPAVVSEALDDRVPFTGAATGSGVESSTPTNQTGSTSLGHSPTRPHSTPPSRNTSTNTCKSGEADSAGCT